MKNFYHKGISVIELLIVIAVLGLIFSIVIPQFAKTRENQVLKSAVDAVLSSINKAQSRTLASVNSSSYGVHFQSDKIIIFTGTVFSSGAATNETVSIITPATITNVTLAGVSDTSGDIYFNRLTGTPDKTGTITIATSSFSKVITISATGSASSN
jgi:Tfp pilus assembly protein FimT